MYPMKRICLALLVLLHQLVQLLVPVAVFCYVREGVCYMRCEANREPYYEELVHMPIDVYSCIYRLAYFAECGLMLSNLSISRPPHFLWRIYINVLVLFTLLHEMMVGTKM